MEMQAATSSTPQSQMSQELNLIGLAAASIKENIDKLIQKLAPVLRSEPEVENPEKALEVLVPHAESIRIVRMQLEQSL